MNLTDLGALVFNSIPSDFKTTVTFTRDVVAAYDPVTRVITPGTALTASAEAAVAVEGGTGSETFLQRVVIREKYLRLTVEAKGLDGFVPQANDKVTVLGVQFRVIGVASIPPAPTTAVFEVSVEK